MSHWPKSCRQTVSRGMVIFSLDLFFWYFYWHFCIDSINWKGNLAILCSERDVKGRFVFAVSNFDYSYSNNNCNEMVTFMVGLTDEVSFQSIVNNQFKQEQSNLNPKSAIVIIFILEAIKARNERWILKLYLYLENFFPPWKAWISAICTSMSDQICVWLEKKSYTTSRFFDVVHLQNVICKNGVTFHDVLFILEQFITFQKKPELSASLNRCIDVWLMKNDGMCLIYKFFFVFYGFIVSQKSICCMNSLTYEMTAVGYKK